MKLRFKTVQSAINHAIASQVSKKTQRVYTIDHPIDIDSIHAIIERCNDDTHRRAHSSIQFHSWKIIPSNIGILTVYLVPKTIDEQKTKD